MGLTLKFIVDLPPRVSPEVRIATPRQLETTIQLRWLEGPYLLCPNHVFLSKQSQRRRRENYGSNALLKEEDEEEEVLLQKTITGPSSDSFLVKCVVRVHPELRVGDISWMLKPVGRERRKLVRVKANAVNETVRVTHASSPSGENVTVVNLAIMESWVRNKRSSSTYLLDLTVKKNSRLATASIQIQWDCATKPSAVVSSFLAVLVAFIVSSSC